MGGLKYWAVNFSYIDKETRQESFVAVPEQGSGGLIPPGRLDPGVTFTVGSDQADGRRLPVGDGEVAVRREMADFLPSQGRAEERSHA